MPIIEIKFSGNFQDVVDSLNSKIGKTLDILQIEKDVALIYEAQSESIKDDISYIKSTPLNNNSVIIDCKYVSYDTNVSLKEFANSLNLSYSNINSTVVNDVKEELGSLATSQVLTSTVFTSSKFNKEVCRNNLEQILVDTTLCSKTPLHEDDPINAVYNNQFLSYSIFAITLLNVVASLF